MPYKRLVLPHLAAKSITVIYSAQGLAEGEDVAMANFQMRDKSE